MKATVLDSRGHMSAVLCEDGIFRQIKGEYSTGTNLSVVPGPGNICVEHKDYKHLRFLRYVVHFTAAASVLFCSFIGMGSMSYQPDVSYATIKEASSITYTFKKDNGITVNDINLQ